MTTSIRLVRPTLFLCTLLAASPLPAADGDGASRSVSPGAEQQEPQPSRRGVLREEHAYFGDRLTIEPRVSYTRSDRRQLTLSGFLALDTIFLGDVSVDTEERDTLQAALDVRYDLTDRLQVQATLPYLYRHARFQTAGDPTTPAEETVSDSGPGDVRLKLFYRWLTETAEQPDVVFNLGITAPTGTEPFGIETETAGPNDNLRFPEELSTGNGVWAVSGGVSVLKSFDPAILFANVGFEHTIEEEFDDINSSDGEQPGKVDIGDSLRFGLGTSFALNRDLSLSVSYSQQITGKSERTPEGGSSSDVIGSEANAGVLNLGSTLALDGGRTLVTNLAIGVTEDASDVTLSVSLPFSL